ncbi:MAG: hypothetical protein KGZ97_11220 [Bacteroidetes bacterium]|nr:hypothetical protein [Bacteroidota bacterium]
MKKPIIAAILFATILKLSAQNIEVNSGVNLNSFYSYKTVYNSISETKIGYNIALSYQNAKPIKTIISIGFEKYSGGFEALESGVNYGRFINADIEKSVASLCIMPFNFIIAEKLDLNVGAVVSYLLKESFQGEYSWWQGGEGGRSDLQDTYQQYSKKWHYGLKMRIAYNLNMSENLFLTPQYHTYFGINNEFTQFPKKAKSFRNYFCIGLKMIIH